MVPPWVYRAVAYDSDDPFRQPLWTCPHNHQNAQEAQVCGYEAMQSGTSAQPTRPSSSDRYNLEAGHRKRRANVP